LDIDEAVLTGEEFEKADLLRQEKDMLGQYVTDHPLLAIRERLSEQTDMDVSELASLGDGDVVTVAGIVVAVGRKYTKRGEPYAVLRLEDLTGGVGIVAFPSVFEKNESVMIADAIVLIKGRADLRGRELQLVALEIRAPDLDVPEAASFRGGTAIDPAEPLVVDVSAPSCTPGLIARMKDLLAMHPGECAVLIQLVADAGTTRLRLAEEYCVDGSPALLAELRRLLGPEAVRFQVAEAAASGAPRS
jgi:DNA polymerase-3 subunit alpha